MQFRGVFGADFMKRVIPCLIILVLGVSGTVESDEAPTPQAQQCFAVLRADHNGDLRVLSETELEYIADTATLNDEFLDLTGNVVVRDHKRTIESEQILYDRNTELISATERATVYESGWKISGDGFEIDKTRDAITGGNVNFMLYSVDAIDTGDKTIAARGQAGNLYFEGGVWKLDGVSLTHCPELIDDVQIKANHVEIDLDTRQGRAKGAILMIFGKPVFYSPFVGFAVGGERLSGYLLPAVGYESGHGTIIKVPYYFNLAPNYDATVSTNILSRRGVQLEGEFRHLGVHSDTILRSEFLHRDNRYPGKEKRYAAHLKSNWFNGSNLYSKVNTRWVSDKTFTRDFSSLFGNDDKYLKQSVEAGVFGDRFKASFGADRYIIAKPTVNVDERTHDRVPWVTYDHLVPLGDMLNLDLGLYVDRFHHKSKLSATRYRTDTAIEYLIDQDFGQLGFRAGGERIDYRKRSNIPDEDDRRYTISSKYFEADGKLLFDRKFQTDEGERVWTIEPRLKFVSSPRNTQENLPVFDTTIRTIDVYDDLFQSKPYIGGDRVRGLEQLSAGVSFRVGDRPGYQNIREFGIGRIFYSGNRMPGLIASDLETDPDKDKSDIFVGANIIEPQWKLDYGMLYDDDTEKVSQTTLRLTGMVFEDVRLSAVYRHKRDDDEQVGALFDVPLKNGLRSRFLLIESVRDHKLKKAEWQLNYHSCCLSIGFRVTRELVDDLRLDNSFKMLISIDNFAIN